MIQASFHNVLSIHYVANTVMGSESERSIGRGKSPEWDENTKSAYAGRKEGGLRCRSECERGSEG